MRIALVINATSGSGSAGTTAEAIRDHLARAGIEAVPEPDPDAPLPERIAAAARLPDLDAVVVAGGDGTIAGAAAAMLGNETPLGILPLGTMNLLARDLGLPLDLDAAVETLRSGCVRRIDVGEVNGRVFLINSVLGMAARLAHHREAQRRAFDPRALLRWALGVVRHLGRYPRLTLRLSHGDEHGDGIERHRRVRLLALVVGDYVERPGHVLARASLADGTFTLYVLARLSPRSALRLALGFAAGDWQRLPSVERVQARELTIDAGRRALRVMNDGEVGLIATPLRYRLRPAALAVIAPSKGTDGQAGER